jgi:uncharacterized protein
MERIKSVDALRGFALFGIAVVNMPFLAAPLGQVAIDSALDKLAAFFVALLFQGKFFLVFAFLFGWGVGVQETSAARANRAFAPRFRRRQLGLFLIGAAHAALVFAGDILVTYAIVGLLLFGVRRADPATLMRWGGFGILCGMLSLALLAVIIGSGDVSVPSQGPGYLGGFVDALVQRVSDLATAFPFIAMFNGPLVFAAFCAGMAAHRTGFLTPGNGLFDRLRKRRRLLLFAGIVANLPFALVTTGFTTDDLAALAGFVSLALAAPLLSLAYIVIVAGWAERRGAGALSSAGQMSLTAYVLEGVLAGFVFNGYGLDLYGQFGMAMVTGIAIAVFLMTDLIALLWKRWFGQGPLERLLRKIAG